jgi:hypothetical protein
MSRPAIAIIVDGHVVRKLPAVWDGTALVEKKRRRKYIVLSEPYLMTEKAGLLGTKAVNVFFVSTRTATSWDPDTMNKWVEDVKRLREPKEDEVSPKERPVGVTTMAPDWMSSVEDEMVDPATGQVVTRPYRVTPEFIFEQSDSSDMKAWNQQQATSKTMLWLAAGAGAAGMVMLYFVFQLVKGTSFFGGA